MFCNKLIIFCLVVQLFRPMPALLLQSNSFFLHASQSRTKLHYTNDDGSSNEPYLQSTYEMRRAWYRSSVDYYLKLCRLDKVETTTISENGQDKIGEIFLRHAGLLYFAKLKVKEGKFNIAESIYRRLLNEIVKNYDEDSSCDNDSLAICTLLLALHLQRFKGNDVAVRCVFQNFVSHLDNAPEDVKCDCTAKVLIAYGLFEMKRGLKKKSLFLVRKAVAMDPNLQDILKWKTLREVMEDNQRGRGM